MWKNTVQPDRPQVTVWLNTSGYKHALTLCNTHCFSTATTAARYAVSTLRVLSCRDTDGLAAHMLAVYSGTK